MALTPDRCECLVPTSIDIAGSGDGPLAGTTFVAKDLFDIAGHTSSFGHSTWRETHQPATGTAPVVARLLAQGSDLVGLAKMDQLAYSLIGNVGEGQAPVNSLDPSLFCGGSSSGSAAAVAAGMADFALGTDTAGSLRVPAAVCGILGIRPTHGALSVEGVIPLAKSFDVPGLFARDPHVLRRGFDACMGAATPAPTAPSHVRVAADVFARVDEATAALGRDVGERIAALFGAELGDIAFGDFTDAGTGEVFGRIQSREIWAEHSSWVLAHGDRLDADVRARLERCERLTHDPTDAQEADLAERRDYRDRFAAVVPSGSIVVVPVLPGYGPKRSSNDEQLADFRAGSFGLTAPASMTGAPQVVWSERPNDSARSIGIGLLTSPGDDSLLLEVLGALFGGALLA